MSTEVRAYEQTKKAHLKENEVHTNIFLKLIECAPQMWSIMLLWVPDLR